MRVFQVYISGKDEGHIVGYVRVLDMLVLGGKLAL